MEKNKEISVKEEIHNIEYEINNEFDLIMLKRKCLKLIEGHDTITEGLIFTSTRCYDNEEIENWYTWQHRNDPTRLLEALKYIKKKEEA